MFGRPTRLFSKLAAIIILALASSCSSIHESSGSRPKKILWAWERPEDLRSIDPRNIGVAFLSQTLRLENEDVLRIPRRQPLDVVPTTYLIAVTRIETSRDPAKQAVFSSDQTRKIVDFLKKTLELPNVVELQIDFDAIGSERDPYKRLIIETRRSVGPDARLSITALASWCLGDRWLEDLPIDEAIPMLFDIGNPEREIRESLAGGNDWPEPKCRSSYGVSINAPRVAGLKPDRTVYYFKSSSWTMNDIGELKEK